jgi:hypothetical protein
MQKVEGSCLTYLSWTKKKVCSELKLIEEYAINGTLEVGSSPPFLTLLSNFSKMFRISPDIRPL